MSLARRATSDRRLRFEPLEDRRVLAAFPAGGVTVITHGAQASGGLPDWTVTLGQAILDRADGESTARSIGSIFQHNGATGLWQPVGNSVWTNSNDPNQHVVLLYDWTEESFTLADGWLDAAADNLFASLLLPNSNLAAGLAGRSFVEVALDAGDGGGLLDLHFIGHSRGGVLNSLVAKRFDRYFSELTIDHVTTLDAHPASLMNDPGYVSDNPSINSRVFTYDNVRFADNYYQSDGSYEPLIPPDFDGVIVNGAYNFQIPTAVLENGGSSLEHSDTHSWYYGTVTQTFAAGYTGFSAAGRNNDGDVSFPEAWWGGSGVPARTAIGFAYTTIADARPGNLPITGAKIAAGAIPTVVDGDIAFGDDGFFSDSLPGWELHGGGGSGPLGGADLYFELNSGGDDFFRRHNLMYLPRHTAAVEFDFWITDSDATDDRLQILVGGVVIDSLSLAATAANFVRDRRATFNLPTAGLVGPVEFRLADVAGDGVESVVRIDNVDLVIQTPPASADFNASGRVGGGDFLAWQRGFGAFFSAQHDEGDADYDGNVAGDDFALWKSSFGSPATEIAAIAFLGLPPADAVFAMLAAEEAPPLVDRVESELRSQDFTPTISHSDARDAHLRTWRRSRPLAEVLNDELFSRLGDMADAPLLAGR